MDLSPAATLLSLHREGPVLALVNVWDGESARLVAAAGAMAIATASYAVAASRGHEDGERMPRDVALAAVAEVAAATSLPLTADLEAGYGDARATVRLAVAAGAVGANIEDRMDPLGESVARMEAALAGAADEGVELVLNARTDAFLLGDKGDPGCVDRAIERGLAFLAAGAACVFVPGAPVEAVPGLVRELGWRRVSVLAPAAGPHPQSWADAGVARASIGPGLWRLPAEEREAAALRLLALEG